MSASFGFAGFDLVRRGYERTQVDAYLNRLAAGERPADPPAFDIVWRGYDRAQVDARVRELLGG